jgi:hypothetical protein
MKRAYDRNWREVILHIREWALWRDKAEILKEVNV